MWKLELDDEAILELMAVVDIFSGFNKLMDGLRVEPVQRIPAKFEPGVQQNHNRCDLSEITRKFRNSGDIMLST